MTNPDSTPNAAANVASDPTPKLAALGQPPSLPESPFTARLFRLSDLRGLTQHLAGRLKTLIDGTTVDEVQRKALKDLIHAMLWEEHYTAMATWAEMATQHEYAGLIYVSPPFSSTGSLPPEERFV